MFNHLVLGKKFTQKLFVLLYSIFKNTFILRVPYRKRSMRCLKINDASIYRIQSMIESGDKYNSNPLKCVYVCTYVCAYFSARTTAATRSSVCLSHLSFHYIHITDSSQRIHSVYVRLPLCYYVKSIIYSQFIQFHFTFVGPPAYVYFYFLFWFWVSFVFIFERNFTMKITTQKALKGNRN